MAVEYDISSDVAVIKEVGSVSQCARVTQMYSGQITYDDEAGSKFATATINGKSQRVMLCIAVSGTVTYDDVPSLYSTVDGHRCLNIVTPTETGTPDDVPSLYETVVIDGQNVRAVRCIMINKTPVYDGVSSTCTFTGDDGKTHTAQLVNKVTGGSVVVIIKGTSPLNLPDAVANSLSYVKAFGGTEQRNLPDGYIQRQFIYMMDNSYLLTDIVPTYDGHYEMDFQTTTFPSSSVYLLGGRTETFGGLFFAKTSASVFMVDTFGNTYDGRYTSSVSSQNNTRYKFTYNNRVATLESGGTTLFTNTSTGTLANGVSLCINGLNNDGTLTASGVGIYLYSFKAWNAQGELVADYVPAVQKGTVPVVGFYDTVSGTFKTATAGTFAAGGEAVPTPDTPMDIVSNNGVLKVRDKSGLPSGYQRVEFLQSSNKEFIDLGYTLNAETDDIELDIQLLSDSSSTNFFGARSTTTNRVYTLATGISGGACRWRWGWVNSSDYVPTTVADTNRHTLKVDHTAQTLSVDGVVVDTRSKDTSIGTPATATLFAIHSTLGDGYYFGSLKIFGYKKWTNNVLSQNLIPCRRKSDSVLGMYDLISNTFLTNGGTGAFTAGADIDDLEIYTDGTVETIKDSLNNTATAEILLKVGDYQDVQSIIDGVVTRNVGVKVLDGTEDGWTKTNNSFGNTSLFTDKKTEKSTLFCSHFQYNTGSTSAIPDGCIGAASGTKNIYFRNNALSTVGDWEQWLADQYAAGTPVIVVYPLATTTTESVAGQPLQVQAGDNVLEITQASLTGLELEAQYNAAVSLTIQEVQDANLDNNVTVTIQ